MSEKEITILSVYHSSQTKRLLELNGEFTRIRNPRKNWVWLVADNSPEEAKVQIDPSNFEIIDGIRVAPVPPHPDMKGSYQLAASLHKLLPMVKTRFLAIVDSDCYVVYPQWIDKVLQHMRRNDLAILGIPWHTRWWNKYRYFPAGIHACVFDLEKIDRDKLDFFPQYDEASLRAVASSKGKGRRGIGISRDMGYAIRRLFDARPDLKYEYLTPVFRPSEEWGWKPSGLKKILHAVIPDRWSYLPKRTGAYTETSFKDKGYFDGRSYGWEEFMWRDVPFCFHLRKNSPAKTLSAEEELNFVREALATFSISPSVT